MEKSKTIETKIIEYNCEICGQLIYESSFGNESCQICREPINHHDEFYCEGEQKHICKICHKNFKSVSF